MIGQLILIGALGAVVGSFLNVVVHRLPRGESLVSPASHCPACGAPVRAYDNVPLLSWLALRGRCRACRAPISVRYPLVELLTAGSFVAIAVTSGIDDDLAMELPFAAILIACAGIDLEHRLIPNRIVVPAAVYGLGAAAVVRSDALAELALAGAGAFAFLLVAAVVSPGGMGMGDVKLAGVMGIYLGLAVIPALLISFLTGSIVGLAIIAREGRDARKKGVPFGPFLALGGLVGTMAGNELISLYADRFL